MSASNVISRNGVKVVEVNQQEFLTDRTLEVVNEDWVIGKHLRRGFDYDSVRSVVSSYIESYRINKKLFGAERLRSLEQTKQRGVKIIPGYGVFLMPSAMTARIKMSGKLHIDVFNMSPSLRRSFIGENGQVLLAEAERYYDQYFEQYHLEVNRNTYRPVAYKRDGRVYGQQVLPTGVYVEPFNGNKSTLFVRARAGVETIAVVSVSQSRSLEEAIEICANLREEALKNSALLRYVKPSVKTLSQYLAANNLL